MIWPASPPSRPAFPSEGAGWRNRKRDRVIVSREIFAKFPDYAVSIVHANGVSNGPSDEWSLGLLRSAEAEAYGRLGDGSPAEHPHIAAWRQAYSRFGSKPSRYPCSAEALLKRSLADELPPINRLVDLYNAVSLRHVLPVGGEDADRLSGELVLRMARGDELFQESSADALAEPAPVKAGEPIWIDDLGVTCRRWNWRQGPRTALGEQTDNAFFVLDALAPYTEDDLDRATVALVEALRECCSDCEIETTRIIA
jgi:DNA/RNA-binding domain of Phe-tRNA-synthetase-like protein